MKEEITILNIIIIILKKIMKVIFNRKQKKIVQIFITKIIEQHFLIFIKINKPNSKLKYTSGGSNSKNIKQFIIKEI